jgi:hypothetical protein
MPIDIEVIQGEQDALLKISPKTLSGKDAEIEAGTAQYTVTDGPYESVQVEPDGKSARVVTTEVGEINGTISGDADLDEGVKQITDTFKIRVVAAEAENLGATGEAVAKVA